MKEIIQVRIWNPGKNKYEYSGDTPIMLAVFYKMTAVLFTFDNQEYEYSIGIKDVNRRDVYERDKVTLDNTKIGGKKYQGEIIWNDDQALSNLEWGLWTKKGYLRTDFLGILEVIGHVHEDEN